MSQDFSLAQFVQYGMIEKYDFILSYEYVYLCLHT